MLNLIGNLSGKQIALVLVGVTVILGIIGNIAPPPESSPPEPAVKSAEKAPAEPAEPKAEYTFAVQTTPDAVYTLFIDGEMVLRDSTGEDLVTRKFAPEDTDTIVILDQKTDYGEVVLTIMDEDRNIVGQIKTTAEEPHWGGVVEFGEK